MPILSAILDPAYRPDDRFIPVPEQATSPDYGFSFDAPFDYASHFNFDRYSAGAVSANPDSGNPKLPPPKLDFNDQNLFYRRLFRLADTEGKPRFYLCPWLIVPFGETSTDNFAVTIKNDSGNNNVGLMVRPFLKAQPDSVKPITTPSAARRFIKGLAPGRKLTLGTTDPRVHAKWTKPGSEVIDEALCAEFQRLEITFDGSTTVHPYPYSCDLTITSDQVGLVGQLCLVFVKMIKIPTILFDVSFETQHTLTITQLEHTPAETSLNGPNAILERCGLRCVSAAAPIKMKEAESVTPPGSPYLLHVVEKFINNKSFDRFIDKKSSSQPARITTQFLSAIEEIDGQSVSFAEQAWRLEHNPFLLVFFMSYVELEKVDSDGLRVGEIAGSARLFSRTAHIFDSTPRVIAHECGHAMGLSHTFYDETVGETVKSLVDNATQEAGSESIAEPSALYSFYDDANLHGLPAAFRALLTNDNPVRDSRYGTSSKLGILLSPRKYTKFSTDNLMDYLQATAFSLGEEARKDQIEQIRNFK